MKGIDSKDLEAKVSKVIVQFHERKNESLNRLKLKDLLKKKNPYLFKAKGLDLPWDLVDSMLQAFISSKEETILGNLLEDLAIWINTNTFGGKKSGITGVDLEFSRDGKRYLISIKSGPNWGNSSQISQLKTNLQKAAKVIRQSKITEEIVLVNGCCYGKERTDNGVYFKYCGQDFWELISGDPQMYVVIIQPIGIAVKHQTDAFSDSYKQVLVKFTAEFSKDFCKDNLVDWDKLLKFNSGSKVVSV